MMKQKRQQAREPRGNSGSLIKVPKLATLLSYRRPARSNSEEEFIARFIDTIPGMITDAYGNRMLICQEAKTIISAHTDTVHRVSGRQVILKPSRGIVRLSSKEKVSNCLGADDTAGIYAALRMIAAGIKATFIFHRDEEIGGRGSAWLAKNYPLWLGGHTRCVALDRRGTGDIITHQAWGRCCSEEFATGLAGALAMAHAPSEHGIFTDSANYVGIIAECSNVSVGYYNEHTAWESLDVDYLEALIERLIAIPWDELPTAPWVDDAMPPWASWGVSSAKNATTGTNDASGYDDYFGECENCLKSNTELYEGVSGGWLLCERCFEWERAEEADEGEEGQSDAAIIRGAATCEGKER